MEDSFINLNILDVHDGLREGLSHFTQPSRASLIYALAPDTPLLIYDPQDLLRGHEPKLKELFLDSTAWRDAARDTSGMHYVEQIRAEEYRQQLTGLISFGGRSESFFFQMWYTEHHPDMCSIGPTLRWLEYAAGLLSRNVSRRGGVNIGTSAYVLQEYATHAVRDHIVDERNVRWGWDTRLRIFPILDTALCVSKTLEEGAWPRGELAFVEPSALDRIKYIARFPEVERPGLKNFKHVRKLLLAVEESPRRLISDGQWIIGISDSTPPPASVIVDFQGRSGFLKLDEDLICSFADGCFHSSTRKANLVQIEETLLEYNLDPGVSHELFNIITAIVHSAGNREHGCTLVLDLNGRPLQISGQNLEQPLDLRKQENLNLAMSLAKVDGAIHIGSDLALHAFACLLDGHTVPGENRARGARFNSALRFSAEHEGVVVIVVSADRPVSVIEGGIELTAQCEWSPLPDAMFSKTLEDWLEG